MLRPYSSLAEVRDARPEVLVAWLRRILARTLADAVKHYERDKRDIALERSLEADLDRSASGFAAWLAADQTSPSGRAERNEELLRMVEALVDLPDEMREVLVLKHCQGWTVTAAELHRQFVRQCRTNLISARRPPGLQHVAPNALSDLPIEEHERRIDGLSQPGPRRLHQIPQILEQLRRCGATFGPADR